MITEQDSHNSSGTRSNRVQRPISLKIFSIALGLLVLMTAVTVLSTYNLSRVNDQTRALADYYIPLSYSISTIELDVRQQLIHLERLIMLQQFQQVDSAAISRQKSEFDKKGQDVETEIGTALRVLSEAFVSTASETDRLELARLEPEIQDVQRAHQHLQDSVLKFLTEVRHGNQQATHVLYEVIVEERKNFDGEVKDVRRGLQRFTGGAAKNAEALEKLALTLNWSITLLAALLGIVFASVLTKSLVKPIRRLLEGTRLVEQGQLNVQLEVISRDEIAMLTTSFNRMVGELKQKEQIKDTFGKFVDPRIVNSLLQDHQLTKEGDRQRMTVLFADLEGFTSFSENLAPDGVVKFLNRYFTLMSEPIRRYNGIIDKYIGDAIMAFWGPPFTSEAEHAPHACLAALDQLAQLKQLRQILPDILGLRKGLPAVNMRIGIATGEVIVGSIGSDFSKGYTVIGDTVNVAARLESANKQYGTNLLISEETWKLTKTVIETREIDYVCVVGKSEPIRVYEVLSPKEMLSKADAEIRDRFEVGVAAYRSCQWAQAEEDFKECLKINPVDTPSKVFLSRVKHFQDHPPEPHWDGVWRLSEK